MKAPKEGNYHALEHLWHFSALGSWLGRHGCEFTVDTMQFMWQIRAEDFRVRCLVSNLRRLLTGDCRMLIGNGTKRLVEQRWNICQSLDILYPLVAKRVIIENRKLLYARYPHRYHWPIITWSIGYSVVRVWITSRYLRGSRISGTYK